jgi:O-antigen ligase
MNDNPMVVPTVIFWILVFLAVATPVRWSVVLYLLLVQIDLSAVGNFSTDSLGIENAIKVIVIPTLLLFKIRKELQFGDEARKYFGLWFLFVGYVGLASLWSPYRVSGIKMTGYLYAYSALFLVFTEAWRQDWFNAKTLMFAVWCSLIGATIQTYFLGNAFGEDDFQFRFTSFAGAQSFAPFLLSILVLLLFREKVSISVIVTVLASSLGLLLTGSRSAFLGLIWVLLLYGIFSAARSSKKIRLGVILKRALLIGAAIAVILTTIITLLPENRLNEMMEAAMAKNATLEDVGTFGWRFSLYQTTLDELIHRSPATLLVGSGTSSGADLVLESGFFQESNLDPNRAIHDEFLRAMYEWGILGLFALLFFLASALKLSIRMVKEDASPAAWAFLAIFVPLLLSLTVENFLADSGSPGGVGYCLVLTCMVAAYGLYPEHNQPLELEVASGPDSALPASAGIQTENYEEQ